MTMANSSGGNADQQRTVRAAFAGGGGGGVTVSTYVGGKSEQKPQGHAVPAPK